MTKRGEGQKETLVTAVIWISFLAGVILNGIVQGDVFRTLFSNSVLAVLTAGVFGKYVRRNAQKTGMQDVFYELPFLGSFFISFLLLAIGERFYVGAAFLLVVVIAAMLGNTELAFSVHIALMIEYLIVTAPEAASFSHIFTSLFLGFLVILLFVNVKEKKALPYLALILLSCDAVLWMVSLQFDLSGFSDRLPELFAEFLSILLFVAVGFGILTWRQLLELSAQEEPEREMEQKPEQEIEIEQKLEQEIEIEQEPEQPSFEWDGMLDIKCELMQRLKEYSEALYRHSIRIGMLSARAAEVIGANTELAKAGGMYHEIGRIEDNKEYIQAGIRLGSDYAFPEELLAVIRQHSTGSAVPQTPEAAVVMLSDCIITTSNYLSENGKREKISDRRLVENIFQNRLARGNLSECGMTEEQLQCLKEFYIQSAFCTGIANTK